MTATLGDLLALAGQHITASLTQPGKPSVLNVQSILSELTRLVRVMDRHTYPDPATQAAMLGTSDVSNADRAVFGAAIGLARAGHFLSLASPAAAERQARPRDPIARHLRTAGDSLVAARDLLQTHFDPGTGEPLAGSGWAPLISARPVSFALAYEMSQHALMLGPLADRLLAFAGVDAGIPTTALHALRSASYWLRFAGTAMAASTSIGQPARATRTLHSIPANVVPPRQPPARTSSVLELCRGAGVTADRLRQLGHTSDHGFHAPAATSAGWRRVAHGAAIITHNCELILRVLGQRSGELGGLPSLAADLTRAADAAERTWTSWRTVARSWDILTTAASRELSPVAAELPDLVVWIGRIARDNPAWTPARSDASQPRNPASLAPDEHHLSEVLVALLRTATVLAEIASQDYEAVTLLARQQGLYIPTRLTPETPTRARTFPYSRAPQNYVAAVLDSYKTATRDSKLIVQALSKAALSVGHAEATSAPELAAVFKEAHRMELWHQTHKRPASLRTADQDSARLQQLLDQLEIDDRALRIRAAVIDYAAQDLEARAAAIARKRGQIDKEMPPTRAQPTPPPHPAQSVQTASQDQRSTQRVTPAPAGDPVFNQNQGPDPSINAAHRPKPAARPDRSRTAASSSR